MELQQFVSESLKQIVGGIADAQVACGENGARINPRGLSYRKGSPDDLFYDEKTGAIAEPVEFDIAVSIADGTQTKGGVGIVVGPIALGSQGQSNNANSTVSRIKFKTLVMLPSVGKQGDR